MQTVRFEWLEVEPVHSVCWRRSVLRQQSSVQRLMGGMRGPGDPEWLVGNDRKLGEGLVRGTGFVAK